MRPLTLLTGPEGNPLARHAARLGSRKTLLWSLALLLIAVAVIAAALQQYWLQVSIYSGLRPRFSTRWLTLLLLAEVFVALPWAACRGALGWQRLRNDGLLEEYRRTRMSSAALVGGALWAATIPVVWFLSLSAVLTSVMSLLTGEPEVTRLILAHAALAAMLLAGAALGQAVAASRRSWAAIPTAVVLLGLATVAILALNPFYAAMGRPEVWIQLALLPNPVTAIGATLGVDVLRYPSIYPLTRAHEYFFVYPPVWQTALFYLAVAAASLTIQTRRVASGST